MRALIKRICVILAMPLAACSGGDDGPLGVVFIGDRDSAFTSSLRLSPAAQHIRAAQSEGLVTLDPAGLVAPGLADRWIVTDEGRSYVFRLRDGEWPDGSRLTAESVRAVMRERLRQLQGTSLGLDLAPVREVRTMADGVIEFRLSSPMPDLLQLLAQPELSLTPLGDRSIPMTLFSLEERRALDMSAPERRGLPVEDGWQDGVRRIELNVLGATDAVALFEEGSADLVLGGSVVDLPLAEVGPLSRGTVRLDPAIGIFGLQVRRATGLLVQPGTREALALALDREALIAPFNIGGWSAHAGVVPPLVETAEERWAAITLEARRNTAAARLANARSAPPLSIFLGSGPGSDVLMRELSAQWQPFGVRLQRVDNRAEADLYLVDRVARFAGQRWFLNQFNCSLNRGLCSREVDALVQQAVDVADDAERAELLSQAQAQLEAANVFIALGAPIRWSLVRGDVTGFAGNQWAFHPLPPLAEVPR